MQQKQFSSADSRLLDLWTNASIVLFGVFILAMMLLSKIMPHTVVIPVWLKIILLVYFVILCGINYKNKTTPENFNAGTLITGFISAGLIYSMF